MVARDNFFFFLECCDFSEYGSLGSVWSVPSWVLEASLLDRHLACQHGCFPSGNLGPHVCWLPEGDSEKTTTSLSHAGFLVLGMCTPFYKTK